MRRFVEYEPTPFYFLNDEFNRDEVVRQLDIMKNSGIFSFFVHVRDGVVNEAWGTDRFFDNVKFLFEQAIARGLKPWIYDEDSFPSGQGGGQIAIDHPEYVAYSLHVDKVENNGSGVVKGYLGRAKGLYAYKITNKNGVEKISKITDCFGPVRTTWYRRDMDKAYYSDMTDIKYKHIRAATSYTQTMFEISAEIDEQVYVAYIKPTFIDGKYGTRVDCMNKSVTEEYIKRVYEKYKRVLGKYFGNAVEGVFIDEPSIGGNLPYTKNLQLEFYTEYGYRFEDNLYKLSSCYSGCGEKFRRDYVRLIKRLYTDNFIKPIAEWCKQNDLKLVGHFDNEEDPLIQALCGENVYENVKLLDVPGFDIITTNIGDKSHPSLIFGSNLIASAASQVGKDKVMAECFALSPFNMGYDGLKRTADWLFASGVNWLVPHGLHYGYCNYHRADAGKSFFFQDTQFSAYQNFVGYAGRVCKLISGYKRKNELLLVVPDAYFSEKIPFPLGNNGAVPSDEALKSKNRLYAAVKRLFTTHTGFDTTQTADVLNAKVIDGKLIVGNNAYSRVIMIRGGEVETEIYNMLKEKNVCVDMFDGTEYSFFPEDRVFKGNTQDLFVYDKFSYNGSLKFIFNTSNKYCKFSVCVKDVAMVYDAEKDCSYSLKVENGFADLSLQAYGSVIIIFGSNSEFNNIAGTYNVEKDENRVFEFLENPQWTYMPIGARNALIRYDLTVKLNGVKKKFKNIRADRLRQYLGTCDDVYKDNYLIPYFDVAPRKNSVYPVWAEYSCKLDFHADDDYILFDRDAIEGEFKIYFNGCEITKEQIKQVCVYDVHNYAFCPKWKKKNTLKNSGSPCFHG